MNFDGDRSVLEALRAKRDGGAGSEESSLLLIIDGGLMKGVYGAGAVIALTEGGHQTAFDQVVGVSSGAPTAAYFLAGEAELGSSIFYEECASAAFIDWRRPRRAIDIEYLRDVFTGSTGKVLPVERVFSGGVPLAFAVTEYTTATPRLVVPQDSPEFFTAMHASLAMPAVLREPIMIDGVPYVDGGMSTPHPVAHALATYAPTHVLHIANQERADTRIPLLERLLDRTLYRDRFSRALRQSAHSRRARRHEVLATVLAAPQPQYAVVWGDGSVGSFERRPEVLRDAVIRSRDWWRALLSGHDG